MNKDLDKLYPQRQVNSVLGNLANDTNLLAGLKYPLDADDFLLPLHKVIFKAITNIVIDGGMVTLTPVTLDNYLKTFPKYYAIWQGGGADYLQTIKDQAELGMFTKDADVIKKYSLLRSLEEQGISVKDLYDYDSIDLRVANDGALKIERMELEDIIEHYSNILVNIKNEVGDTTGNTARFEAKDDIRTLLNRIHQKPVMGYPFSNGAYNSLFRGMRAGKYMLRSASTGGGKTRTAIKDLVNIACDEIYIEGKGWQKTNANYPTLFISTELNKDELQMIILAYLSGLTTGQITEGHFAQGEIARLEHAVEVIERSTMYFEYIEDFSIADVDMIIENYVNRKEVGFVVFDYIQNTPKMSRNAQDSFGHNLREDEILTLLSRELKAVAEKYNIFILSSTQLNGEGQAGTDNALSRTSAALRGSKAIADKVDYGIITSQVRPIDLKKLQPIIEESFGRKPTYGHFVYKNRAGLKEVIIWTIMNLGNMREEILYVTDYNYDIIEDVKIIEGVVKDYNAPIAFDF